MADYAYDGETREFYAWVLYDWETKTKRFFDHNEKGPGSIGEFYQSWKADRKPSEHLYQFQLKVRRDGKNPEFKLAEITYFKEDWITRRPLAADESEFKYTAKRLLGMVQEALPPDSFGPEKGPFQSTSGGASEDQVLAFFTIPTMSFEVSVKRLTKGRQPAVVAPAAPPSKGRTLTSEARQHLWNSLYASAVAERTRAMYETRWASRDAKKLAWPDVIRRENDGGSIHEEAATFADEALKTFEAWEAENA